MSSRTVFLEEREWNICPLPPVPQWLSVSLGSIDSPTILPAVFAHRLNGPLLERSLSQSGEGHVSQAYMGHYQCARAHLQLSIQLLCHQREAEGGDTGTPKSICCSPPLATLRSTCTRMKSTVTLSLQGSRQPQSLKN